MTKKEKSKDASLKMVILPTDGAFPTYIINLLYTATSVRKLKERVQRVRCRQKRLVDENKEEHQTRIYVSTAPGKRAFAPRAF